MTTEQLLAAVLANPGDDELRKVYGDALVEIGHPQGELIALQFARLEGRATPEALAREQLLLERHGADVLGPLISVVDGYTIERGFLHACTVPDHRSPYNVQRVAGHSLWSTVEVLAAPPAIYLHPVMRSLRSLTTHYSDIPGVTELCTGATIRPLTRLVIHDSPTTIPHAVFEAPALPDLVELGLPTARSPDDLARIGALGRRLAQLELSIYDGQLVDWYHAVATHQPARVVAVRTVVNGPWQCSLEAHRNPAGVYDELYLRCEWRHWIERRVDLSPLYGRVRELRVLVVPPSYRPVPQPALDELADAVARFPVSAFRVQ